MKKKTFSIYLFFTLHCIAAVLFTSGCRDINEPNQRNVPSQSHSNMWFRQSIVDLGMHIQMLNSNSGFASSRGRGQNVPGHVYRFSNGIWNPILTYPYSDYPLISAVDSASISVIHHLVHSGNCRPLLKELRNGSVYDIQLPKITWDASDYVMLKGFSRTADGSAFIVGQQGHILMFDGKHWKEIQSPLIGSGKSNMYEGDLNDVFMLSPFTGWAVGRSGVILQYANGRWERYSSPTQNDLLKINFADERHGWIVGDKGTVLKYNGSDWRIVALDVQQKLTSVKAVDSAHAFIVGANSTLLAYDGVKWTADESIKTDDDTFNDIDAVGDLSGKINIWIIGDGGIYTNSQSLGFSFTDITSQAALRRTGRGGIFFNLTNRDFPDLLVLGDEGPNLLFSNNGHNIYSEAALEPHNEGSVLELRPTTLGDVNNDGALDILEIGKNNNFNLMFGTSGGKLRNIAGYVNYSIQKEISGSSLAVRFVDFDNDGNLDAYISSSDSKDNLLRGGGTGKFERIYDSSGIEKLVDHRSFGVTFGDFNNDGLVDIVIPYYVSENKKFLDLFLNDGNFKFHVSPDSSFLSKDNVAPTVCIAADINNDGNLDIVVHNQGAPPWILLNNGDGHFRRVSSEIGFTSSIFQPDPTNGTVAAGDVNNDGWIDLFIASKLFLNQQGERFIEASDQTGIQFTGHPSFADIDNDGDLDLFIGSSQNSLGKGDRAALFRNNLNDHNFIKVRVLGDISNRSAIGAKVFIEDTQYPEQKQIRTIGLGSSPLVEQNISEAHFGVKPGRIYNARVAFPSGKIQILEQVTAGSIVELTESSILPRAAILATNSVNRTIKMIEWEIELVKFSIAITLIILLMFVGAKSGAGKFTNRWFFPLGALLLYLSLLHTTIMEQQLFSSLISFSMLIFCGVISIVVSRTLIRKREAKFVSHFKLLNLLGQGGMGRVFKALDVNSKQTVAIKILNPEIIKDTGNKKRLLSEGQLLNSFSHPNIVKVFEVADSDTGGFIAMEYLSGGTLKQLLEQSHPLPLGEIRRILVQICGGLKEVHSHGIVHRDLKSGNIMFDADRNIRIMDFGLSKSPLVTTMTSLGTVLGTLGYVAPEQVTNQNVDQRTDIFSLGVIIYELLTNTLPFKGENEIALIHSIFNLIPQLPSQLREDRNTSYDALVMKCMAKNPNERYANVEEVMKSLPS
jgi:hypothetical protein